MPVRAHATVVRRRARIRAPPPDRASGSPLRAAVRGGRRLGLVDFGYRALDSLRLEKAYRLWGADMSADYTPLEAGLERFVKLDKGDFVGRDALLRQREAGGPSIAPLLPDRRHRRAPTPHAYEPVLRGRRAGHVRHGRRLRPHRRASRSRSRTCRSSRGRRHGARGGDPRRAASGPPSCRSRSTTRTGSA